jgi:hypothetical protein
MELVMSSGAVDQKGTDADTSMTAPRWSFRTSLLAIPRRQIAVAFLVATLGLVPVALVPRNGPIYAGIANLTPTLYTYTIAILLACVVMAKAAPRRFFTVLLPWAPFLVWIVALTLSTWDFSPRTMSGLLQLGLGALAFAVGAVAERQDRDRSLLAWAFAAVAWGQLFAIASATVGLRMRHITGAQALDIQGRATGLTAHPGELSKLLFFCGLCALTLPQRTTRERWAVWLTLAAVFIGVFLTQSRTVLVAVISMVFIFMLLEFTAGRWQRKHLAVVGLTVVLGAASLPWLIDRFAADPNGGARQHVAQVALRAVQDHPWAGVGPNSYVAVIGALDRLTATGVPVHNVFLLTAAELGIVGALFLWLPFVVVSAWAMYHVWRTRGADQAARIIVSALPGICLIGMTGWGLLQGPYLAIFFLVIGYFGARTGSGHAEDVDVHR